VLSFRAKAVFTTCSFAQIPVECDWPNTRENLSSSVRESFVYHHSRQPPTPAVKAGEGLNRNSPSRSCFGDTKYCNVKSRYRRLDGFLLIIFFSYFNVL